MTVKGPHSIMPHNLDDLSLTPSNHTKVQNGSSPTLTKSPPKDSNLNHYRLSPEKATSRPITTAPQPPPTQSENRDRENRERENRKEEKKLLEKEQDREQERQDEQRRQEIAKQHLHRDRDKRLSRELSPLDHRGNTGAERRRSDSEIVEKDRNFSSKHQRQMDRQVSNSKSSPVPRSQCLTGVIYPLMSEVSSKLLNFY